MNRCLCCGKELLKADEVASGWHSKCVKSFFGTSSLPDIDVSKDHLEQMADEAVNKRITITGVQKKLSLHLSKNDGNRLTIVNYPTGYILKPQTAEYSHLPEFEHITMSMANFVGIKTVPHALVKTGDSFSYITKRIDRNISDESVVKYAMEDFCQLSGKLTADKYKGSYEQCGRIIKKYSSRVGFDISEFYLRILFCFITGNSDMHLKNFSLIETDTGSELYELADAYDLLPANLILPEDNEETALTLNGKKRNLTLKDFIILAENIGIDKKSALRMINNMLDKIDGMLFLLEENALEEKETDLLRTLISSRAERLK